MDKSRAPDREDKECLLIASAKASSLIADQRMAGSSLNYDFESLFDVIKREK